MYRVYRTSHKLCAYMTSGLPDDKVITSLHLLYIRGDSVIMRKKGRPIECICPECKFTVPKQAGLPCRSRKCPRCGKTMK